MIAPSKTGASDEVRVGKATDPTLATGNLQQCISAEVAEWSTNLLGTN
jgi:hypothetical protein